MNSFGFKEFEILNDKRRLTVAVTRAKKKLILIGCVENLVRYKPLCSLISFIKEKDLMVNLNSLADLEK
jgi:DNA replication ATP-dependent helicase Dna2